jgi:hypothetical protein
MSLLLVGSFSMLLIAVVPSSLLLKLSLIVRARAPLTPDKSR